MIRLRHRKDFERVRGTKRSWAHPFVVLLVCPNNLPHNRFGVVAGKGVGSAVLRNRAKRLLREAIRALLPEMSPGWDIVLIARQQIRGRKLDDVTPAVKQLLGQAQILRQSDV